MQSRELYELRAREAADTRWEPRRNSAGAMSKTRLWIIITDRSRPMREIVRELTDAGLVVGHVLEAMGGISGTAEDKVVEDLRRVRGVLNIWPDSCLDVERISTSFTG